MAIEKVIDIKINSNLENTEKGVKSLGDAIKLLDAEATNLDATFEEVYGDLKPLTARMGEAEDRLYELAKAGKQNTQEYKDLLNSVAAYKKVQQQTDLVVDAASQTMGSKLSGSLNAAAGGFALVQGSMALMGTQSAAVEETLLKVQAAMAISQGVETINQGAKSVTALGNTLKSYSIVQKLVTAGQYLWNTAIMANPIGAIVAGVVALIAAGVALVSYFKSSSDAAAKNTSAVNNNKKAIDNQSKSLDKNSTELQRKQNQELAMAKASGESSSAIRVLELKLIDEKIAYEKSARAIAYNTYEKNKNYLATLRAADADEDVIKKQVEITNESVKQVNKQNDNLKKAYDEKKDIQNRHQVEVLQSQTNHNKDVADKNKEAATKAKEDLIAQRKKDAEDLKSALQTQKDAELAKRDEITKAIGDAQDKQAEKNLSDSEVEQRVVKDKYFGLIELAKQQNRSKEEIDALEVQRLTELNDIKDKFRLQDDEKTAAKLEKTISDETLSFENRLAAVDAEQAIFQKQLDDKLITEEQFNDKTKALSAARVNIDKAEAAAKQALFAKTSETLNKGADLLGKNTAAGKAMAAAAALINTYQGITAELATKTVTPFEIGLKIANVAIIAATGFKAVKDILSVQVPGGGGGGGGGGAQGGSAPSMTAPSFNTVGSSSTNQLAQTIGSQSQTPIKSYVVASDVSTAQALDRSIISNAAIG